MVNLIVFLYLVKCLIFLVVSSDGISANRKAGTGIVSVLISMHLIQVNGILATTYSGMN
jgi:hypothetical protein